MIRAATIGRILAKAGYPKAKERTWRGCVSIVQDGYQATQERRILGGRVEVDYLLTDENGRRFRQREEIAKLREIADLLWDKGYAVDNQATRLLITEKKQ